MRRHRPVEEKEREERERERREREREKREREREEREGVRERGEEKGRRLLATLRQPCQTPHLGDGQQS